MKYKFKAQDLKEELKAAVGDKPCRVTDTGVEMILEFDEPLAANEEAALTELMAAKPLLRGKLARFVEKGVKVEVSRMPGATVILRAAVPGGTEKKD